MKRVRQTLVTTVIGVMIGYVVICFYFYFAQDRILFKPQPLPEGYRYSYRFEFEERWFIGTDGNRIHAIHAKSQDSAKGLVLFFHGNAGNNDTHPIKFRYFLDAGYDVLYPDYRSYGKSTGKLKNEEDLVGDMKRVFQEMAREYKESDIVVVGYSLGSGIASLVAAEYDPKGVVLWAPYYSMLDMKDSTYPFLPDFLLRYPLRTDLALQKIDEPLTIYFAKEDQVLPMERSIRLIEYLKESDEYIILENQRHSGLFNNPVLYQEIPRILAKE